MGWRYYAFLISKEDVKKFRKFRSYKALCKAYPKHVEFDKENIWFYGLYDLFESIAEFGKYVDFIGDICKKGKPLFSNKKLQNQFEKYCPYVIGKEGLEIAIQYTHNKIKDYYKSLFELSEINKICKKTMEQKWKTHIESIQSEWNNLELLPYNMDLKKDCIVDSWKYEYEIFELVRLYKSTDFKKYDLLFMGY